MVTTSITSATTNHVSILITYNQSRRGPTTTAATSGDTERIALAGTPTTKPTQDGPRTDQLGTAKNATG